MVSTVRISRIFFSKNWKVSQNRQNYHSWIIFKSTGQKTGRRQSDGHFEGDSIQFVHSLQTYSRFRRTSKPFWLLPENEIIGQKSKPKFSCLRWVKSYFSKIFLFFVMFTKRTSVDNNFFGPRNWLPLVKSSRLLNIWLYLKNRPWYFTNIYFTGLSKSIYFWNFYYHRYSFDEKSQNDRIYCKSVIWRQLGCLESIF